LEIMDRDYSFSISVSEDEYRERIEQRDERIYTTFVEPVLDESLDGRAVFQPNEVQDNMRPPYSYTEVKSALEYGSENSESVELAESDMDLFLYKGD
jgi:hypothetical protein